MFCPASSSTGFLIIIAVGIRREETTRSLTTGAADRAARAAQLAASEYVRLPGAVHCAGQDPHGMPSGHG